MKFCFLFEVISSHCKDVNEKCFPLKFNKNNGNTPDHPQPWRGNSCQHIQTIYPVVLSKLMNLDPARTLNVESIRMPHSQCKDLRAVRKAL